MPSITIRNVPDEVYRAIRVRAAMHGVVALNLKYTLFWSKPPGHRGV